MPDKTAFRLVHLKFAYWDLFVIWCLKFGIFHEAHLYGYSTIRGTAPAGFD